MRETMPTFPRSPYAVAKLAAEDIPGSSLSSPVASLGLEVTYDRLVLFRFPVVTREGMAAAMQ